MLRLFSPLLILALSPAISLFAADPAPNVNYDESKAGSYTLPDPLTCADGTKVTDAQTWREKRRPELMELFRTQMYGRSPGRPAEMKFQVTSTDAHALNDKATRKEITISFTGDEKDSPQIHLLLYVPNEAIAAHQPVPAFLGITFDGNHSVCADPGITITEQWVWDKTENREKFVRPPESARGKNTSANFGQWPVETILARGYALATIPRADIEPDYPGGWKHGIRGYFLKKSGKSEFAPDDWGAIAAWAWSLSRTLDYLETDHDIDSHHI